MLRRAVASQKRLAELNPYVTVDTMIQPLDDFNNLEFLNKYQARDSSVSGKGVLIVAVAVCGVVWG